MEIENECPAPIHNSLTKLKGNEKWNEKETG